jgi:N-methylhydantoinase B
MDFSKSAKQAIGPANTGWAGCLSGARTIMKALIAPKAPSNAGFYRPLKVVAPKGLVVNALKPAPVSMYHECVARIMDVVWQVLAPLAPDKLPAGHYSSCCATGVWGNLPDSGKFTLMLEPQCGGWGASPAGDGESALICLFDGDTYNIPAEVAEARYPYRVEQYRLREDSGGLGRFRGGLGIVRDYRMTGENLGGLLMFERHLYPPFGLEGGGPGATNDPSVHRQDGTVLTQGKGKLVFTKGDLFRLESGGGGGYGDPLDRDPALVAEDVLDGYVSREAAQKGYGVVFRAGADEVDVPRTQEMRKKLRAAAAGGGGKK